MSFRLALALASIAVLAQPFARADGEYMGEEASWPCTFPDLEELTFCRHYVGRDGGYATPCGGAFTSVADDTARRKFETLLSNLTSHRESLPAASRGVDNCRESLIAASCASVFPKCSAADKAAGMAGSSREGGGGGDRGGAQTVTTKVMADTDDENRPAGGAKAVAAGKRRRAPAICTGAVGAGAQARNMGYSGFRGSSVPGEVLMGRAPRSEEEEEKLRLDDEDDDDGDGNGDDRVEGRGNGEAGVRGASGGRRVDGGIATRGDVPLPFSHGGDTFLRGLLSGVCKSMCYEITTKCGLSAYRCREAWNMPVAPPCTSFDLDPQVGCRTPFPHSLDFCRGIVYPVFAAPFGTRDTWGDMDSEARRQYGELVRPGDTDACKVAKRNYVCSLALPRCHARNNFAVPMCRSACTGVSKHCGSDAPMDCSDDRVFSDEKSCSMYSKEPGVDTTVVAILVFILVAAVITVSVIFFQHFLQKSKARNLGYSRVATGDYGLEMDYSSGL